VEFASSSSSSTCAKNDGVHSWVIASGTRTQTADKACGNKQANELRRDGDQITSSATASSPRDDCTGSGSPTPRDATSSLLLAAGGAEPTPRSHARTRGLLPGRARASSPARRATAAAASIGSGHGGQPAEPREEQPAVGVTHGSGLACGAAALCHFCVAFLCVWHADRGVAVRLCGCVVVVTVSVSSRPGRGPPPPILPLVSRQDPRARGVRFLPACSRRSLRLATALARIHSLRNSPAPASRHLRIVLSSCLWYQ
jgi:hypothetical protein